MTADVLAELVTLSNRLGEPERDYAILGEGNTSARIDDGSFWVKASGAELRRATREHFVRVGFDPVLALLEAADPGDEEIRAGLAGAMIDRPAAGRPSVETVIHAVCLRLDGVRFVGHTHPTWINMITCSQVFEEVIRGALFPDHVVVCGPAPIVVPYVDPGIPLARAVRQRIEAHLDSGGERPKVIYLQNHGIMALGETARQVEDITAMAVKACRILVGACAAGGATFLSSEAVQRIHSRPDEHYRQRMLEK